MGYFWWNQSKTFYVVTILTVRLSKGRSLLIKVGRVSKLSAVVVSKMESAIKLFCLALCVGAAVSDDRVVVGFYSEALCPDCLRFSMGPLSEAFEKVSLQ